MTNSEAARFATESRNSLRHELFLEELRGINKRFGGEPRNIRRSMARDKANRKWWKDALAKA